MPPEGADGSLSVAAYVVAHPVRCVQIHRQGDEQTQCTDGAGDDLSFEGVKHLLNA